MKILKNKNKIFLLLGIIIPAILVFRAILLPGPLAWGDSHHFYSETLEELQDGPSAWVNRENNFGGTNNVLWLYPIMSLRSLLVSNLGLNDALAVRLLFFLPGIVMAFVSAYIFGVSIGLKRKGSFFASLIYGLNTYFILLVDGGQLGIVLSYSIFPLVLVSFNKLINYASLKNFVVASIVFLLATVFDPRIALIAVGIFVLWLLLGLMQGRKEISLKSVTMLIFVGILTMAVSSYWIFPFLGFGQKAVSVEVSNLQLFSLLNPLTLFQPHWPGNQFGEISQPPFYFIGIPLLVFVSLLLSKKRKHIALGLLFLIFSFLTKGEATPLGSFYSWFISNIPLGSAFRDSSKFMIPTALFGGVLIGFAAQKVKTKVGSFLLYVYLLLLIGPALMGNLNGVLAAREFDTDLLVIKEKIEESSGSFRTIWFPERHPLTFQTERKPALDAKNLVSNRPFASMNVGTYDRFNFLDNEDFLEWFRLLGIRYMVFSGDPREVEPTPEEQAQWDNLLAKTATISGLQKRNWGTDIPVYEVPDVKARMFAVDRVIGVVGGESVYESVSPEKVPTLFFEDGVFDPRKLDKVSSDDFSILIEDGKTREDLTFSLLQNSFVENDDIQKEDWGEFESSDYLLWKYQLLIRDVATKEFDYGKGIYFSTEEGEKIRISHNIVTSGSYIIAVRSLSKDGGELEGKLDGKDVSFDTGSGTFSWSYVKAELQEGMSTVTLENPGGLRVLNTIAFIKTSDWDKANVKSQELIDKFSLVEPARLKEGGLKPVEFEMVEPSRYRVDLEGSTWLIFTDSYSDRWEIGNQKSFPFYSMINGFYTEGQEGEVEVEFGGQDLINKSLKFSLLVLVLSTAVVTGLFIKSR